MHYEKENYEEGKKCNHLEGNQTYWEVHHQQEGKRGYELIDFERNETFVTGQTKEGDCGSVVAKSQWGMKEMDLP